jgi:hypothetical protein
MNSLVLVMDGLHLGYLGAYGNCWIDTPEFDRLASQAFVFDQMLIDTPRLELLYRSYWQGWHAAAPAPPAERRSLVEQLNQRQVHTVLVTDDPYVGGHPLAGAFRQRIELDAPESAALADSLDETHVAACFAQLIDLLPSLPKPFWIWCHLSALGQHWDAPWDLRTRYVEEGDPDQGHSAEVPSQIVEAEEDHDAVVAAWQAYAGQVVVWDACLGALVESLDEHSLSRETLLAVTSSRGLPLGEHGRIGWCDLPLHSPLVHVPLVLRLPDGVGAACRSQALVEPADLWSTQADFFQLPGVASPSGVGLLSLVRGEDASTRDRLVVIGEPPEMGIRTPAWYLRDVPAPELFAKPDDRWEVNNVADRCRDVVEHMQDAILKYCQEMSCGTSPSRFALDDLLLHGPG